MLQTMKVAAMLALCGWCVTPLMADEHEAKHAHDSHAEADIPTLGIAVLLPTKGNKVRGVLRLVQQGEDLKVLGRMRNLTPGKHGFHIHQFGDLRDAVAGKSAGGHFNPTGVEHGTPEMGHVGDLGNIEANEDGVAKVDKIIKDTKLHFVLGRSFVVHADPDDLESQPSGNAGPRVALAVIGVGNPDHQTAGKTAK